MEEYIDYKDIKSFFRVLEENNIEYVITNNTNNALPFHLLKLKDIDILINSDSKGVFFQVVEKLGFERIATNTSNVYVYKTLESCEYINKKKGIILHVFFRIICKTLIGYWIPLDKKIQLRALREKERDETNTFWIVDKETKLTYMLVRCLFDKKNFTEKYIVDIELLLNKCNMKIVRELLEVVVFKYAERFLMLIKEGRYREIIEDYIRFEDY